MKNIFHQSVEFPESLREQRQRIKKSNTGDRAKRESHTTAYNLRMGKIFSSNFKGNRSYCPKTGGSPDTRICENMRTGDPTPKGSVYYSVDFVSTLCYFFLVVSTATVVVCGFISIRAAFVFSFFFCFCNSTISSANESSAVWSLCRRILSMRSSKTAQLTLRWY